jgi:hypothetical protein
MKAAWCIHCMLVYFFVIGSQYAFGEQTNNQLPCTTVDTMLVTQFIANTATDKLPRVEARRCGIEEKLYIVGWREDEAIPALVIDTTDFVIVQAVARGNVFLLETTGGSRDIIWVVVFKKGTPKLELKRVTKGTAKVTLDETHMHIIISGIWAGDEEPITERYDFSLSLGELFLKPPL